MGVLESIGKSIDSLSQTVLNLEKRMMEIENNSVSKSDSIVMKFDRDDNLNISFASKFLKMTKSRIIYYVKNGELQTIGDNKYIFKVSELIDFKKRTTNAKEEMKITKPKRRKRLKSAIENEDILVLEEDVAELIQLNR